MKIKAFTLIELLIVVAIIAILAAIAVPNFLEAQTRAKVSRAKADMRTVATGLEAYHVDNSKYPPDFTATLAPPNGTNATRPDTFVGRLSFITTPIAYLTSIPEDFFARSLANSTINKSAPYKEGGVVGGEIIRPITYDYARFDLGTFDSSTSGIAIWELITSNVTNIQWALNSMGPDQDITQKRFLGEAGLVIYDSSNGTISVGQIIRSNVSPEENPEA